MRFEDSLTTVLAADMATEHGAQSAWRQLVDLIGRRRVAEVDAALVRLDTLRAVVPAPVRSASARALAWGEPPAALVAFFAQDDLAIAAPVLRTAVLSEREWLAMLPRLTPALRSVLRNRRDLPAPVVRGLESFGSTDFALGHDGPAVVTLAPRLQPDAPLSETPFVAVGDVARAIPVVAEALSQAAGPDVAPAAPMSAPRFEIADMVSRIEAYRRDREPPTLEPTVPAGDSFQFHTDPEGVIRWIEGTARAPLIGVSLAFGGRQGAVELDAAVVGALRARSSFRDALLQVGGSSTAAGAWRVAGEPRFDRVSGRFTGMGGIARRPRRNEVPDRTDSVSDSLRQLVHELRTPANAIAGFAELIGSALLGPVPPTYGDRAQLIQRQAGDLMAAIDDLDTAARIEGHALDLRLGEVDVAPLLARIGQELAPLAAERRALLSIEGEREALVHGDDRAIERLIMRLLATALSAAAPGERLRAQLTNKTRVVRLAITRPRAFADHTGDALLTIDAEPDREGAPLLGAGFTLRLVRNLAITLGGRLGIESDRLTLRLPAAHTVGVGQVAIQ